MYNVIIWIFISPGTAQQEEPEEVQRQDTFHCETQDIQNADTAYRRGEPCHNGMEELFCAVRLSKTGFLQNGLVRCRQILPLGQKAQSAQQQMSDTRCVENTQKERT